MSYHIRITEQFKKEFKKLYKKYPSLKADLQIVQKAILQDTHMGTPLGKNCYKIRISIKSKGKGKSGGGRVISFFKMIDNKIYLLSIYDKSAAESISDKEIIERIKTINI